MENNYKFSWKAVYNGWAKLVRVNLKLQKLTPKEIDVVISRVETCTNCKYRTKLNICGACNCYLPAKVLLMKQKCKEGLWER